MNTEKVLTFCQRCHMRCRLYCQVADGKVVHITNGMGIDCPKGINLHELLYHPDRLRYPLKRFGQRGEGKWQRISWDEALDTMAERFSEIKARYGADAIATIRGSSHKQMARLSTILFSHVIGTPNVLDVNEECNVPSTMMAKITTGDASITFDNSPDFRHSSCILLWGSNMRHTRLPLERDINIAQANGAKLIVVDPRPPERRDMKRLGLPSADIWLRVRPGTDAALALGMIHVIINEGLYNKEFVDKWCLGFEELKERVQEYTPERVADITWIPQDRIVEAARLFATTSPSCLHLRLGAGGGIYTNCAQTSRAITILLALAGDIDFPGGNLLCEDLGGFRDIFNISEIAGLPYAPGVEEKRLGAKDFPLVTGTRQTAKGIEPRRCSHNATSIQAMLEGKLKAFFVPGANIAVSLADISLIRKALMNLEFLTVVDLFMTPTTALADLVLPAAHFLETELPIRAYQSMGSMYNNYILAPRRVIEPVGECWDDRKIVIDLARRMGIAIPWQDIEQLNDWQLEEVGIRFHDIQQKTGQMLGFPLKYQKYHQTGFNTPLGKIELRSSILENLGYDPLPYYQEPSQSPVSTPGLAADYPLIMIDRRSIVYTNSEFQALPSMLRDLPGQEIEVNPETATELGIEEGDEIFIERPGFIWRVKGKARLVPELHPKVISCFCLRWFPDKNVDHGEGFEINTNAVTSIDPPYDPIIGNFQIRGLLCRVGKVEPAES